MGAPVLASRAARAVLAAAVAFLATACEPDPTGPGTLRYGPLRIHPVLESAVDVAALDIDSIAVTVRRVDDGTVVADTVLSYDADPEAVLAWFLGLDGLPAMVEVSAEARAGGVTMFAGTIEVEIVEAAVSEAGDVDDVIMPFVGPGANVVALTVTPADALLTFGAVIRYEAAATDGAGQPVPNAVIVWSSSDPALAPISADAELTAPGTRGAVTVTAQTPGGVSASAAARFQPAASNLEIVEGDGANAPVATNVTLTVRVVGADGLGVEGTAVTFAAPAGAVLGTAVVQSGADGTASTEATLPIAVGDYVFTAEVGGVAPVGLAVNAVAGPPAALEFVTQPTSGKPAEPIAPAVDVRALDAFGNIAEDGTEVVLGLGANPTGAMLLGNTGAIAANGVAAFPNLSIDRPGMGYTLVASATGLPPVESAAFDMAQIPETVEVTPGSAQFASLGDQVDLDAVARDEADEVIAGQVFAWTSSDVTVATVDAAGVVTAVGNGDAIVTATAGEASGQTTVTVQQIAAQVAVTPNLATLDALQSQMQLTAIVRDANANLLEDQSVTWTSTATGVATVDAEGRVTAVANGAATIEAAAGSVTGAAMIVVVQRVTSVAVTPDTVVHTAIGAQTQLAAVGRDANGNLVAPAAFTWTSDRPDVATVDATGLVTAVANGTAVISAADDDGVGSATITVTQAAATLAVSPGAGALTAFGDQLALTATVRDANGFVVPDAAPVWTSLAAAVATVDADGLVTAQGNGGTEIVATLGVLTDRAAVTVAQEVAEVLLTPDVLTFDALASDAQITAAPLDRNGFAVAGAAPVWSSDDVTIAPVDAGGRVVSLTNGVTLVRATVGGIEGVAEIEVRQRVLTIALAPGSVTFAALQDQALIQATGLDPNGNPVADAAYTWSIDDATVATVDPDGLVTALANGDAIATATADDGSASIDVTVDQVPVTLEAAPTTVTFDAFGSQTVLSATARDANGFAVADAVPTWASAATPVATVDPAGVVTAVANGDATVTATVDALVAEVAVSVDQVVTEVLVVPDALSFAALGDVRSLSASPVDANGFGVADAQVTWSSEGETIATVDQMGGVTSVGNGATIVRALAEGIEGTATVDVTQRVTQLALTVECVGAGTASGPDTHNPVPACDTLTALGDQALVTTEARDANGYLVVAPPVVWSSLDPAVATVDGSGIVTAVGNGAAVIRAEADDAVAEVLIVVRQHVVTLSVDPAEATLAVAGALQLVATGYDRNGFEVAGLTVQWRSRQTDIATVTRDGVVLGHAVGHARIDARAGEVTATAIITVE